MKFLSVTLPEQIKDLTLSSDLPEVDPFVVEDLDAVSAVVGDEDLLPVVDDDAVGELEVLGAAKLGQNFAHLKQTQPFYRTH